MSQTTYRKISQMIRDAHYDGRPLPEAPISERFIAERVAAKVAKSAVKSAYGNSNLTEATYASDQFISVYTGCALLTDSVTKDRYCVFPATPAGLPKGREIAQISFTGSPNVHVIPMANKDDFIESGLPPMPQGIVLYKIEQGRIVFRQLPAIINSPVNMKLVGAIPSPEYLLDSVLQIPKDVEDDIFREMLAELQMEYGVPPKTINIAEPTT